MQTKIVDSHCHLNMLDLEPYANNMDNLMEVVRDAGVGHMLCVSVDLPSLSQVIQIAEQYSMVSASVGVHPNESNDNPISAEQLIELASLSNKVVAFGETGLDFYHDDQNKSHQKTAFANHIEAGRECDKAIIIHTRAAQKDTIDVMKAENARDVGGVMHCFTEDWAMAKQALDLGFYISFSGIVTFKNATQIQEVAQKVPLDRMLVETDAPFLAPTPLRGKPNYPHYVVHVAEYIAKLRGESLDSIVQNTSDNFFRLFQLGV